MPAFDGSPSWDDPVDYLGRDLGWHDYGLCKTLTGQARDDFWPESGTLGRKQAARAKSVCGRCPVVAECLQYALDNDEQHGVWGGLDVRERAALRKQVA